MSSSFLVLDPALHPIAEIARAELSQRYSLRKPLIEVSIANSIPWRPTFLWKRQTEFLACEVADRPLPPIVNTNFMDIVSSGLPIRILIAYPQTTTLSNQEFHKDMKKAKQNGIGLIPVDLTQGSAHIDYKGISTILTISNLDSSNFKGRLKTIVKDSYDLYMMGDPKHAVQELGQQMEKHMKELAHQAQKKGKLTKSQYVKGGSHYNLTTLLNELIDEKIIDLGILGTCRGFVYPRNDTSHPQTLDATKKLEKKYKENFLQGVRILEELPRRFKEKGYIFKP